MNGITFEITLMALLMKQRQLLLQSFMESEEDEIIQTWLPIIFLYTNDKIPKLENYDTEVVPSLSDITFRQHFRITKGAFEIIVAGLFPHWEHIERENMGGNEPVSLQETLLIALWVFATPDSYRSIGERFNVSKSTVYLSVQRAIYLINHYLSPHFIKWPTAEERQDIAASFEQKTGFPQIIGCIDGCHIPIRRPVENGNDYYNRKKFYSVVLQGICKSNLCFVDVYCRWPGSVHDARVFRTSPIYPYLEDLCNPNFFILSDSAYPLHPCIMPPYKNNGHLTRPQQYYNVKLSRTRVCIENAFALLKGRFRRLKYLEMYHMQDIVDCVVCCCVLHNVCTMNEHDIQDMLEEGLRDVHLIHNNNDFVNDYGNNLSYKWSSIYGI